MGLAAGRKLISHANESMSGRQHTLSNSACLVRRRSIRMSTGYGYSTSFLHLTYLWFSCSCGRHEKGTMLHQAMSMVSWNRRCHGFSLASCSQNETLAMNEVIDLRVVDGEGGTCSRTCKSASLSGVEFASCIVERTLHGESAALRRLQQPPLRRSIVLSNFVDMTPIASRARCAAAVDTFLPRL